MSDFAVKSLTPIIKPINGAVTGIGASSKMVITIPPGSTYTEILLKALIGANPPTRAQFETMWLDMRLIISGVEQWTLSAKQLIMLAEFYNVGIVGDTGYLVLNLERLWMQTIDAQNGPAYGLLQESSLVIEINQDATSTIDSVVPMARIQTRAELLGRHTRISRQQVAIAATGLFAWDGLPIISGEFIYALHFQVPVIANFTLLSIVCDNIRIADSLDWNTINRFNVMGYPPRTPQTAKLFQSFDFCSRGYDADALAMIMDQIVLEMTFATAAPNNVTVIAEISTLQPTQAGVSAPK